MTILTESSETPEEGIPRPEVKAYCQVCRCNWNHVIDNKVLISPSGMAHFGTNGGDTHCGRDATGDEWWWPL